MNTDALARQFAPLLLAAIIVIFGVLPSIPGSPTRPTNPRATTRAVDEVVLAEDLRAGADPLRAMPIRVLPMSVWASTPREGDPSEEPARRKVAWRDCLSSHLHDRSVERWIVMLAPSSAFPEAEEWRRRARVALHAAMTRDGYSSNSSSPVAPSWTELQSRSGEWMWLGAPVEYFDAPFGAPRQVGVIWVAAPTELVSTGSAMLQFVSAIRNQTDAPIDVYGPDSSDELLDMIEILCTASTDDPVFDRVTFQSVSATMPRAEIMAWFASRASVPQPSPLRIPTQRLTEVLDSISQWMPTDDNVMTALVDELARRIPPVLTGRRPRVAVLYEADTAYGRTLLELARARIGRTLQSDALLEVPYWRGLDGNAATKGGSTTASGRPNAATLSPDDVGRSLIKSNGGESAFGEPRLDYMRRIAADLAASEAKSGPIVGILVLGSDYYDKLFLLMCFRPEFPDRVFLTTDLDARMLDPEARHWTRNLVVASALGLSPDGRIHFRSPIQTALYTAIGTPAGAKPKTPAAQLFEVGRTELVPLEPIDSSSDQLGRAWSILSGWCRKSAVWGTIAATLALIVLLAICHVEGRPRQRQQAALNAPAPDATTLEGSALRLLNASRGILLAQALFIVLLLYLLKRIGGVMAVGVSLGWLVTLVVLGVLPPIVAQAYASVTGRKSFDDFSRLWWIVGLASLVAAVCAAAIAFSSSLGQEPYRWLEGVSVLPTETVRLAAAIIALWAAVTFWIRMDRNRRTIEREFFLLEPRPSEEESAFRDPSLLQWQPLPNASVACLWHQLTLRSTPAAILIRVLPLTLIWTLAISIAFAINPPMVPARGALTFLIDSVCTLLFVTSATLLNFLIWDRIRTCIRFISLLPDRGKSIYPRSALESIGAHPELTPSLLDLRLIAALTDLPRRMLYLPVLLFALASLARTRIFDNWGMGIALAMALSLSIGVTIHSAVLLRAAARAARASELDRLESLRAATGSSIGALSVAELESFRSRLLAFDKGPFGSLGHEPAFQAIFIALAPFLVSLVVALTTNLLS